MLNSERIYKYYDKKYTCGNLGLIKCLTVSSMFVKNKTIQPLSLLTVAPSGHFKSRTTIEIFSIFSNKNALIDVGSDFTIHSLHDKFDGGKKCDGKTIAINDLTLLFSSKSPRTKDRLANGLAELLSEGIYQYGERNRPDMSIQANISIIANITKNSFLQNKKNFLDNTFIERLVPFFYSLNEEEQISFAREIEARKAILFGKKIRLKKVVVSNILDFNEQIIVLAKMYQASTLSPSLVRSVEKIRSLICSLCALNCSGLVDEYTISKIYDLLPYFALNSNNDSKIIQLYLQGISVADIAKNLQISDHHPYKVIRKYRERGLLS